MNFLQYWPIIEAIIILAVFGGAIFWMWKQMRTRAKNPPPRPTTFWGRFRYSAVYVLRLVGFALGLLLALIVVITLERSLYSINADSKPAPSEVNIPPELGFEVEEVTFESEDGLTMAGWYAPPQNGVTVILLHGYGGNRTAMLWHARQLVPAGYGVLMYDERASGESEGTHRSFGWEDARDVWGAIRFIEARSDNSQGRIGMAGCSIGGQISLQSAAYYPEIGAVWSEGAGGVRAQDLPISSNPLLFVITMANYPLDWMFSLKLGVDAPTPLIDIIGNIAPRPIMLVGGGLPRPIIGSEEAMQSRLLQYAGDNANMWIIPDAGHCGGRKTRPEEYAAKMLAFFDAAFGITR
ncbi:MAG: alpha/beta fold hydrolase [Anaerolineaceae bacterium]|nr:MAG: alpha/beta fold hydrolase [Anaerolineaceae bacterium]